MSVYEYSARTIQGQDQSLSEYEGKVLLIVNTASKCGFTPQYEGLEKLYKEFHDQGFEVLGFPCNQFMHQEPGSDDQISSFCSLNFGVTFPMFSKVDVNGDDAHPLYRHMTEEAPGLLGIKAVKWNFTKFLVNRQGKVVKRFAPTVEPESIRSDIQKLL